MIKLQASYFISIFFDIDTAGDILLVEFIVVQQSPWRHLAAT